MRHLFPPPIAPVWCTVSVHPPHLFTAPGGGPQRQVVAAEPVESPARRGPRRALRLSTHVSEASAQITGTAASVPALGRPSPMGPPHTQERRERNHVPLVGFSTWHSGPRARPATLARHPRRRPHPTVGERLMNRTLTPLALA